MVIMNYTLLNVFLAIAVDGLADFEVSKSAFITHCHLSFVMLLETVTFINYVPARLVIM